MLDLHTHLSQALEGRYVLEQELGRGGMATVWMAHDLRHQRPVALKVIHPELAAGLGPERFLREIRVSARLQHLHILPVFDSGVVKQGDGVAELLWYTMPYIDGESLRQRLHRESQLPLDDALRIAREVAEALEYANGLGIVHRDVKPENILLSRGHALLADFGIARAFDLDQSGTLTGTGISVGTPVYMSPEQAMGGRDVDGRSDVYSLGCVLYEMIAGEPPHSGPNPQAIVAKRLLDPVPEIERCRPGVPAAVRKAVRRALATMPVDRYHTAGDFARALATAETAPEVPGVTGPVLQARRREYPKWIGVGVIVTALTLIAIGLATRRGPRPPAVSSGEPLRLAVLPFENLGDSGKTYLTDGIAEAVRGKLARLPMLRVISSTGTEDYRRTGKPIQQVGRELGVSYVLVGKVRWSSNRAGEEKLQVSPELIGTTTGSARSLLPLETNPAGLPRLQAELALGITQALGVELGRLDRATLSDSLTANPEAYAAYLRARDYVRQVGHYHAPSQLLTAAVGLFERAIELDNSFALAKVGLAEAHRLAGSLAGGDPARYRKADSLLSAVLERQPDLPEALAARGDIRRDQEDLDAAIRLYERAVSLKPSDASLLARLNFVQSLRLDSSALRTGARAVALAPRDPEILRRVIAGTSVFRRFDELERYSDRLIALDPSDVFGYLHKALAQVLARGDTAAALRTLSTAERMLGHTPFLVAWVYAMCGPSGWQRWHRFSLAQIAVPTAEDTLQYFWYRAQIAAAEGRKETKRAYADSIIAAASMLSQQTKDYGFKLAIRSYGQAVRGDQARARRDLAEAETALRKIGPSGQAFYQVAFVAANAELGDLDRALAGSRWLLEEPALYTKYALSLSPEFARLWGYPPFEQLLADTTLP